MVSGVGRDYGGGWGGRMEFGKGAMLVFWGGRQTKNIIAPLQLRPNPRTKGGAIVPTALGTTIWGGPTYLPAAGMTRR